MLPRKQGSGAPTPEPGSPSIRNKSLKFYRLSAKCTDTGSSCGASSPSDVRIRPKVGWLQTCCPHSTHLAESCLVANVTIFAPPNIIGRNELVAECSEAENSPGKLRVRLHTSQGG